jgi:hypothetical protein
MIKEHINYRAKGLFQQVVLYEKTTAAEFSQNDSKIPFDTDQKSQYTIAIQLDIDSGYLGG